MVAAAEKHLRDIARRSEQVEATVAQIPAPVAWEALAAEEDAGLGRAAAAEAALEEARRFAEVADAAAAQKESEAKILERGLLKMDPQRHACTWKNDAVTLTVTEFLILQALATRPGIVKSRNALMDALDKHCPHAHHSGTFFNAAGL